MAVHRMTGRLHDENVCAAHVFLDLNICLAIREAGDESLAHRHAKKVADLAAERFVGGAAKNLELVICTAALRLTLGLFVGAHLGLLFRRCRKSCHSRSRCLVVRSWSFVVGCRPLSSWANKTANKQCQRPTAGFLAGPLGFEPRQSAPKALDLPLVDGPVRLANVGAIVLKRAIHKLAIENWQIKPASSHSIGSALKSP